MKVYRKYRNKKTEIDGILFDSIKEGQRYCELKLIERSGLISDLSLQPKFKLLDKVKWNGKTLRTRYYIADFQYKENGKTVVEDVKGMRTQTYLLKRHLFLSLYHDINFIEV